jgi:rod shape-determining protein MreD
MSGIRDLKMGIFLLVTFLLQETAVSQIHFPITGFSMYLAVLLVLLSLESRNGTLILGFIGGLIMDLSIAADTPFGQWALVLTIVGYIFSINKESIGDFSQSPIFFLIFISFASALSLLLFLVIGTVLGQEHGSLNYLLTVILANTLWCLFITPLVLPLIIKIRTSLLSDRERV